MMNMMKYSYVHIERGNNVNEDFPFYIKQHYKCAGKEIYQECILMQPEMKSRNHYSRRESTSRPIHQHSFSRSSNFTTERESEKIDR